MIMQIFYAIIFLLGLGGLMFSVVMFAVAKITLDQVNERDVLVGMSKAQFYRGLTILSSISTALIAISILGESA